MNIDFLPQERVQWRTFPLHQDIEAVRKLTASTKVFSSEEIQIAGELVEEALAKGCQESGYYFQFMYERDVMLAYSCYGPIPLTQSAFDLYWIAVSPNHQGQGLARQLQERSERHIQALGGTQIYAETSGLDRYKSAHMFYEKQGYQAIARFPDFYKPGDAKLIYHKQVKPFANA